jgi:hypothetical protein
VCQTPAQLRGAEPILENWTSAPAPELVGQPLLEGRYVQTARTLYCARQYDPPPVLSSVQGVLEIRGCVIRVTVYLGDAEQPLVGVRSFDYRADGALDLQLECAAEAQDVERAPYGFDGTTLLLPGSVASSLPNGSGVHGPAGEGYDCQTLDSWQLR